MPYIKLRSNMNVLLTKCFQLNIIIIMCQLLLADKNDRKTVVNALRDKNHTLISNCSFYEMTDAYRQDHPNGPLTPYMIHHDHLECGGRIGEAEDRITLHFFIHESNSTFAASYQLGGITLESNDTEIPCKVVERGKSIRGRYTYDIITSKPNNGSIPNRYSNQIITSKRTNFTLNNIMKDATIGICDVTSLGGHEKVLFQINLTKRPTSVHVLEVKTDPPYVVRTRSVELHCQVYIEHEWDYEVIWKTPNEEILRENLYTTEKSGAKITFSHSIKNVTAAHSGNYTCILRTTNLSNSLTLQMIINDPNNNFIRLTPNLDINDYRMTLHQNVTWIVDYTGHPNPTITWLDPRNRTITTNIDKYHVDNDAKQTVLNIYDLDFTDMGVYKVIGNSGHDDPRVDRTNFHLSIWSAPEVMYKSENKSYYQLNEQVEFACAFTGYPQPDVKWNFLEYSDNSTENKNPQAVKFTTVADDREWVNNSTVKMKITTSGNLSCDAHNTYGSLSSFYPIFVLDMPNGFGIIAPTEKLIAGEDVKLICRASIHKFTDSMTWKLNDKPLDIGVEENYVISKNRTSFSYESILQIKTIGKFHDNTNISCEVMTHKMTRHTEVKHLTVGVPARPTFLRTNMVGTEYTYRTTIARSIIKLQCYVSGMPQPVLSWFKENKPLNEKKDFYRFTNDNQELEIINPRVSDSGDYTCRAKNRYGISKKHQRIRIHSEEVLKSSLMSIVSLLIISVILVIYFSSKMHREKIVRKQLIDVGLTHFDEGALQCLNPELTVDDQADLLPYDKKWEFPRERLKFDMQLGCGAFGVVMRAKAERILKNELSTTVAVKMVRRTTESIYIRALASELKVMVHLGKHLNVVNLLGACTRNIIKGELLVIVEYCRYGNLHDYLLRHRSDFINLIDHVTRKIDLSIGRELTAKPAGVGLKNSGSTNSNIKPKVVNYVSGDDFQGPTSTTESIRDNTSTQPGWRSNYNGDYDDRNLRPICTQDLLSWAFQVARGMEYLSQRKILHGDLAARNILLAENGIVKICDFGLARTMYNDENYEKKGRALLPIKWMAIESIRDRIFSTQSDVWSFGIVLWEFFTLAETPYALIGAEKLYHKLIEGYRMKSPEFSTDDVYEIMLKCWDAEPSKRPTFTNLVQRIGDLLDENVKTYYLDLNAPYVEMNAKSFENEENDYLIMMSAPDHNRLLPSAEHKYMNSSNITISSDTSSSFELTTPPSSKDITIALSAQSASETTLPDLPVCKAKLGSEYNSERVTEESSTVVKLENNHCSEPIAIQKRHVVFVEPQQLIPNINDDKSNQNGSEYCESSLKLKLRGDIDNMNLVPELLNKKIGENNSNDLTPRDIEAYRRYVNIPNERVGSKKCTSHGFTNPSYLFMANIEDQRNVRECSA